MGDENNSAPAANLNSPADPVVKTRGQFLVYFWKDRFFLFFMFHIPVILIIPILPIFIPEENKKTRLKRTHSRSLSYKSILGHSSSVLLDVVRT